MGCYAAYAKDENIRKKGSSGGIYPVLSKYCLSKGYIVYASIYETC